MSCLLDFWPLRGVGAAVATSAGIATADLDTTHPIQRGGHHGAIAALDPAVADYLTSLNEELTA